MKNFLTLICTIVLLTSCEKYVDIKKRNDQALIETTEDCQLLLNNYDIFNSGYPTDGEASADDYSVRSTQYSNGNITSGDRDIYTWQPSAKLDNFGQWASCYNKVYNANLILEAIESLKDKADAATLGNLRGSALFMRAYSFWNLAQLYAKPYQVATAGQDPGLPLRTVSDISTTFQRSTVQETYDLIVRDLTEAVDLLNTTSIVPTRPNKAAAYAMLARVYLSMGSYDQALVNASAALQLRNQLIDFNTLSTSSRTPLGPPFNSEIIFHSVIGTNWLLNPGTSAGNSYAVIAPDLVSSYNANDLRGQLFVKNNGDGTFRFSGNYDGTTNSNLFNGLAVDELYLVRAECQARAGNTIAALIDLNTLLKKRYVNSVPYVDITAANADGALAIILQERRKELLMRGQRWTDLRRLNLDNRFKKDQTRTVTLNSVTTTHTLPANDPRYVLLIPNEAAIKGNLQQNPR